MRPYSVRFGESRPVIERTSGRGAHCFGAASAVTIEAMRRSPVFLKNGPPVPAGGRERGDTGNAHNPASFPLSPRPWAKASVLSASG